MNKSGEEWRDEQKHYWDSISLKYDDLYLNSWSILENSQLLDQLSRLSTLKSDCHILDIGCGTGLGYELCQKLIVEPFNYIGIDLSPEMITICRQKWVTASFFVEDMSNLSRFPSNYFNTVICLFTAFSYSDKPKDTLSEIFRVIKPGGELFLSVLSKYSLRRLLKGKHGDIERYSTRYSPEMKTIPAHVYSTSKMKLFLEQTGFDIKSMYGQGSFSGVFENPIVWSLDSQIATLNPDLCHLFNVHAMKCT